MGRISHNRDLGGSVPHKIKKVTFKKEKTGNFEKNFKIIIFRIWKYLPNLRKTHQRYLL